MTEFYRPKGLSSSVVYRDPKTAFRWLENVFGFTPLFVLLTPEGELAHAQMTFGHSVLMVSSEWDDDHKSPQSIGGKNTQWVHVQLAEGEDLDAHCARAKKAGAEIIMKPQTQFYGDRSYRTKDLEGHIWTFSVTLRKLTPAQWDAASGLITKLRLD